MELVKPVYPSEGRTQYVSLRIAPHERIREDQVVTHDCVFKPGTSVREALLSVSAEIPGILPAHRVEQATVVHRHKTIFTGDTPVKDKDELTVLTHLPISPLIFFNAVDSKKQPLYFLSSVPEQWITDTLLYNQQTLDESTERSQELRWEQLTGVRPQDSQFALSIPLRDEGNMGATSLATTIIFSEIPDSVHADYFLVSNACTDNGETDRLIKRFLFTLPELEQKSLLDGEFGDTQSLDPKLEKIYFEGRIGEKSIFYLSTNTPSKANVLRLVNSLAKHRGHTIAMNVDANNFTLPDSIPILFGQAHKAFVQNPGKTVLLSGKYTDFTAEENKINGLTPRQFLPSNFLISKHIAGALCAWDVRAYDRIGIPQVALDDYGMCVVAQKHGYDFRVIPEAKLYGWSPTLEGRVKQFARTVRGLLQLIDIYPDLKDSVLSQKIAVINDAKIREEVVEGILADHPELQKSKHTIIKLIEQSIEMGKEEYMENPRDPSFKAAEGAK